jgi:hypothetical protein
MLDVLAIVRFEPVAKVPETRFRSPPLPIDSALFSVTVFPGLSIVTLPVTPAGRPLPVFWFDVPL